MGRRAAFAMGAMLAIALEARAVGEDPASLRTRASVHHTVQPGESVWRIAHCYGVPVEAIARANGMADAAMVLAGQRLLIPLDTDQVEGTRASSAPTADEEEAPDSVGVDALLTRVEYQLERAQFWKVLESIVTGMCLLDARTATTDLDAKRARLEVLAATAQLAFEREDAARRSLERALGADPRLEIDPATSPAKLLRLFESVKAQ